VFKDKVLLITGGTGSFGNAVLNRFLNSDLKEIRIFSRDEKKQHDMRVRLNNKKVKFYIGDVRDYGSIYDAVHGVDLIFHAAALKQVPSCEFFPIEAVRTNVIGTENVLNAAIAHHVKKVIVLSTDKAVYPINVMGLTKSLMEKVMVAKSRNTNHNTILCGTRYGNVMASRGSVIPLFIDQIKAGEKNTITDPQMTRFLMSLDEAVDLVLYAFNNGNSGDIFIQKAPASTIGDLSTALQELYGVKMGNVIIGTRHGEKLFESLINREEMVKAIDFGDYYKIPADNRDLNYDIYYSEGENGISEIEEYTSHNTHRLSIKEIKKVLLELDIIERDIINEN
jgi:UDP-N-acetylglucosamine 4,6-dehydratase/5-epimerase